MGAVIVVLVVSRSQHQAAFLLAKHFDDISVVGPLTEALEYRNRAVREAAATSLIRLLPRLQATDTDLLTFAQRGNLHRALLRDNVELALAILSALEQVGDGRAIPNVQKLASGFGLAHQEKRVQESARQTLACLRQRVELQRAPQILLRAASASEVGAGTLLRPAAGVADTQEHVLLRPANVPVERTD